MEVVFNTSDVIFNLFFCVEITFRIIGLVQEKSDRFNLVVSVASRRNYLPEMNQDVSRKFSETIFLDGN